MELGERPNVAHAQRPYEAGTAVAVTPDKTARVWDAASGKALSELMKHDGYVSSAQFSADGQRVVTASGNGTARVWDAATSQAIGEPMRHEGVVISAQFSADE